jgi:hypothetical protein
MHRPQAQHGKMGHFYIFWQDSKAHNQAFLKYATEISICTQNSNSNSGDSNHILNKGHTCGTERDTMDRKEGQTFEYLRKISHLKNY